MRWLQTGPPVILRRLCVNVNTVRIPMKMNRLIPMLPVRSMPDSVKFYCGMLGFEVERRQDDWGWAMLRFDECRLMVDQSINAHPAHARDSILYLYPDDIVAYHRQVRQNGLGAQRDLLRPDGVSDQ